MTLPLLNGIKKNQRPFAESSSITIGDSGDWQSFFMASAIPSRLIRDLMWRELNKLTNVTPGQTFYPTITLTIGAIRRGHRYWGDSHGCEQN